MRTWNLTWHFSVSVHWNSGSNGDESEDGCILDCLLEVCRRFRGTCSLRSNCNFTPRTFSWRDVYEPGTSIFTPNTDFCITSFFSTTWIVYKSWLKRTTRSCTMRVYQQQKHCLFLCQTLRNCCYYVALTGELHATILLSIVKLVY